MEKTRVFSDTNIFIEAIRTGCWIAISDRFAMTQTPLHRHLVS